MTLQFWKMNGAGNDFVMLDNRDLSLKLDAAAIARLCDRHRGVGADGVLLAEPARNGGDFRMRYYNADGGEAEMCGNGARCFARFVNRLSGHRLESLKFETLAGMISAVFPGDQVRINMSAPHSLKLNQELDVADQRLTVHSVNTGVPHAVVFVEDLDRADVLRLGSALRHHPAFAPKGTNANFVKIAGDGGIAIRTYERGVEGETLACGTGMVACALVAHETHHFPSPVAVKVKGGDTLQVGFVQDGAEYSGVTLHGPAEFVFRGETQI